MANQTKKKTGKGTKSQTNGRSKSKTSTRKAPSNTKKKKTTSTKKKGKHDSKVQDQGINMGIEVQLVVFLGLMVLLMLSNFGICGEAGNILSGFFFGIFGCVQYVMPLAIFIGIAILLVNDYSGLAMKKCFAAFVFLMMVSGFVQLYVGGPDTELFELFSMGLKNRLSGGVIGGGLACLLKQWFGIVGASIILFCILILSLIMLTQRSMADFFQKTLKMINAWMGDQKEKRAQRPPKEVRRRKTVEDREREKQCEDKVKEIEEEKKQAQKKPEKQEKIQSTGENGFRVPVFQPSDEVKRKDSVKELHPEIYPFTLDDGKTVPFEENLDFTAFSFNSGKSADEYAQDLQKRIKDNAELEKSVHEVSKSMGSKGLREIATSVDQDVVAAPVHEDEIPDDPAFDILPSFDDIEERKTSKVEEEPQEEADYVFEAFEVEESDIVIHKEDKKENIEEVNEVAEEKRKPFTIKKAEGKDYIFPPLSILEVGEKNNKNYDSVLKATAQKLQDTLRSFGVNVKITDISFGPTVTRYEMVPEQGTKVSKIVSLTDDIKLNLAAADIRIEAPIPGKSAIGIEVPNKETLTVHFRELLESDRFRKNKSQLSFAVGKDIGGQTVISDIAKMPHLLIAGATGSGKSVCINTLIMSILYKAKPDEVKLIMIDPKMVELSIYNGIPHLLIPVVTDPKKASGALNWAVAEMTERYNQFTQVGVRNIAGYNDKVKNLIDKGEVDPEKLKPMPQIVVIIDELADLMMVAPGEVEDAIVRLSQLARAAGIHLVIATQRPSVNVITGLIKANVPSRIAFAVSSGVDSRTIIDMNGAEKLLGRGDMLFYPSGSSKPSRVQGAFISDEEIAEVVEFLKDNEEQVVYDNTIEASISKGGSSAKGQSTDRDEYFEDAARFLLEKEKASIGMLQRMFKIGFNRAARIMDQLADAGIVGPEEGTKPRKILMSPEQLEQYFEEYL